jgi:hypothetical protein
MEAAAEHDLDTCLGGERRPVPVESTAGVSLSGLTGTAGMGSQALLQSQLDSIIGSDVKREESAAPGRSMTGEGEIPFESLYHPIDVVDLTPPTMVIQRVTTNRQEAAIATGQVVENSKWISVLAMVFHAMRADDINKHDIISIRDILHPSTYFPS